MTDQTPSLRRRIATTLIVCVGVTLMLISVPFFVIALYGHFMPIADVGASEHAALRLRLFLIALMLLAPGVALTMLSNALTKKHS